MALVASLGLFIIALGNTLARADNPNGELLFWGGIILIAVPVFVAQLSQEIQRSDRVALAVLFGLATYLVKVLHSPSYFTLYDELLHTRTAVDILSTGQLFNVNPLLVVSPIYPGLEIVTTAIVQLFGVSIFDAGVGTIAVARLLLMLGLFLVFEYASGSARVAGIATFIYGANQNFVFFDSQFAYESIALPLAVIALYATARWQETGKVRTRSALVALPLIVAVVLSHHLTTYILMAFLLVWMAASRVFGKPRSWRVPAVAVAVAATVSIAWIVLIADEVIRYMEPRVHDALQLFQLILGDSATRPLFQTSTGVVAPLWERIVAIGSVVVIVGLLPFGLWRVWKMRPRNALSLALAVGALGYPASLALRLSAQGSEEATRAPEFVFLGAAYVSAICVAALVGRLPRLQASLRTSALSSIFGMVFAGGIIVGLPRWARMPGPYLVAADPRSIDDEGIDASSWTKEYLGANNRIVADRINRNLMGALGEQYPVTSYGDQVDSWRLFYTSTVDNRDRQIIKAGNITVLVADVRLTRSLPLSRVYFEAGEPHMFDRKTPLDSSYIDKWDLAKSVSRFFDSGDIRLYDVSEIDHAP